MSVAVDIRPEPDYLHSAMIGEFTVDEVKHGLSSIVEAADRHQRLNVLIDCSRLNGDPSLKERFELVSYAFQLRVNRLLRGHRPRLRTAIVAVPPLLHPNRYAIRLLVERNMNVTIVEQMDDALTWLRMPSDTAKPPDATDPGVPPSP